MSTFLTVIVCFGLAFVIYVAGFIVGFAVSCSKMSYCNRLLELAEQKARDGDEQFYILLNDIFGKNNW